MTGPLQHTFARWDGKGVPRGVSGEAIAIAARVFAVANYVEVEHRRAGIDPALKLARRFAGSILDPHLVEVLTRYAPDILAGSSYRAGRRCWSRAPVQARG